MFTLRIFTGIAVISALGVMAGNVSFSQAPTEAHIQAAPIENPGWNQYVRLARSSSLDWTPDASYQLKISYELNDLNGKPLTKGSATQSFSPESGHHNHISSAGGEWDSQSSGADDIQGYGRERFLVLKALEAISHPIAGRYPEVPFTVEDSDVTVSDITFHCFKFTTLDPNARQGSPEYCLDSSGRPFHIVPDSLSDISRSDFKRYGNWSVPQVVTISYEGKVAITAHLVDIKASIDNDEPKRSQRNAAVHINSGVMAGMQIKKKNPKYPGVMRMARVSGNVVLCAIIDKAGKIQSLDAVASPNENFTKSAIDAVKTWEYKPYLVNGEPVEVETTITVNYNIN